MKDAASQSTTSKDDKIVLHCKGGVRSLIASSLLKKLGFKHVSSVDKGIDGLMAKNVKTVPLAKEPISKI